MVVAGVGFAGLEAAFLLKIPQTVAASPAWRIGKEMLGFDLPMRFAAGGRSTPAPAGR